MSTPGKHFQGLRKNEVHFQANWNIKAQRIIVEINVAGNRYVEAMTAERYEEFCNDLKQEKMVIAGLKVLLEGGDKSQIYNYFFQVLEGYKAAKEKGLI